MKIFKYVNAMLKQRKLSKLYRSQKGSLSSSLMPRVYHQQRNLLTLDFSREGSLSSPLMPRVYHRSQGLTLIEVGLAIAVGAAIVISVLYLYRSAHNSSIAAKTTQDVVAIVGEFRQQIAAGVADPSSTAISVANVTPMWNTGLAYKITYTAAASSFTLAIPQGIPVNACSSVANNLNSSMVGAATSSGGHSPVSVDCSTSVKSGVALIFPVS